MSPLPLKHRVATISLQLLVVIGFSIPICIIGRLSDALLSPWFWVYAVLDGFYSDVDIGRWPVVNFGFALVFIGLASRSRDATILMAIWLLLNYLGSIWFMLVMKGPT